MVSSAVAIGHTSSFGSEGIQYVGYGNNARREEYLQSWKSWTIQSR